MPERSNDEKLTNLAINAVGTLKDYDYVKQRALKGYADDPCIITTDKSYDRILLQDTIKWLRDTRADLDPSASRELAEYSQLICDLPTLSDERKWELFGGSRIETNKKEAFEKFFFSVLACLSSGVFFSLGLCSS
jgi:hypothetical protein